jgi:hypothetical protein
MSPSSQTRFGKNLNNVSGWRFDGRLVRLSKWPCAMSQNACRTVSCKMLGSSPGLTAASDVPSDPSLVYRL